MPHSPPLALACHHRVVRLDHELAGGVPDRMVRRHAHRPRFAVLAGEHLLHQLAEVAVKSSRTPQHASANRKPPLLMYSLRIAFSLSERRRGWPLMYTMGLGSSSEASLRSAFHVRGLLLADVEDLPAHRLFLEQLPAGELDQVAAIAALVVPAVLVAVGQLGDQDRRPPLGQEQQGEAGGNERLRFLARSSAAFPVTIMLLDRPGIRSRCDTSHGRQSSADRSAGRCARCRTGNKTVLPEAAMVLWVSRSGSSKHQPTK